MTAKDTNRTKIGDKGRYRPRSSRRVAVFPRSFSFRAVSGDSWFKSWSADPGGLRGLVCLCLLALVCCGCVSKSKARLQAEKSFLEGQQKALVEQQQQQQPVVWFRGDVRNQRIPWVEGLTLSRALLAAQYTWSWDPRTITVTRAGELYQVDPRRLLRGQEDPELEPGDLVEVRH